jgi:two-component system, cell cycle response regulator DivK
MPAPKWILVADDDQLVRELWCEALSRTGYRTLQAQSGRDAIDLMRIVVPDLMILDLRMPGLSGSDVLRHLHESPILRQIPVLIVSGFLDDEASHDSVGLHVVGRLAKPLTLGRLLEVVQAALNARQRPPDPPPMRPHQPVSG